MKKDGYGFLPKTFMQWIRVIIALIAIILSIVYILGCLEFNNFVGWITLLGFIGYLIESLITNIKERKG